MGWGWLWLRIGASWAHNGRLVHSGIPGATVGLFDGDSDSDIVVVCRAFSTTVCWSYKLMCDRPPVHGDGILRVGGNPSKQPPDKAPRVPCPRRSPCLLTVSCQVPLVSLVACRLGGWGRYGIPWALPSLY